MFAIPTQMGFGVKTPDQKKAEALKQKEALLLAFKRAAAGSNVKVKDMYFKQVQKVEKEIKTLKTDPILLQIRSMDTRGKLPAATLILKKKLEDEEQRRLEAERQIAIKRPATAEDLRSEAIFLLKAGTGKFVPVKYVPLTGSAFATVVKIDEKALQAQKAKEDAEKKRKQDEEDVKYAKKFLYTVGGISLFVLYLMMRRRKAKKAKVAKSETHTPIPAKASAI